jgi:ATP-dependent Lon protease
MTKKDNDKTPKKHNLRKRKKNKNYKLSERSDSDEDNSDWTPGDEDVFDECENVLEFQKFLQQLFPSKNQSEKVKQLKNIKKMLNRDKMNEEGDQECGEEKEEKKPRRLIHKKNKKKKKKKEKLSEEEEEEEKEEEEEEEEEEEDLTYINEDGEEVEMDPQNMKFNIVFTMGDKNNGIYDMYDDYDEEDEDEAWNRAFEKALMAQDREMQKKEKETQKKENSKKKFKRGAKVKIKLDEWKEAFNGKITRVYKKSPSYDVLLDDKELNKRRLKKVNYKYIEPLDEDDEMENTLKELKLLLKTKKGKGKKAMMKKFEKMSKTYEKKISEKKEKEDKKKKTKNSIDFRKLLREKAVTNDFTHFKKLDIVEQENILKKLKVMQQHNKVEKPYRLSLIESNIPVEFKTSAMKKINILDYMDPSSGEYYKIKQWVDTFMRIPFNKTKNLPLTMEDGVEKCNSFMEDAKRTLDEAVYGLDDAKMQIMQMIGQWIANPDSVGNAIAIAGPPGTGKTTLVKYGISKILQRPFSFLALGGATDSSFLEGHSYTYEGSCWGKIVDILIQSKYMNPVIYFDELDKISSTPKGEEITGILTHLTDTTQNDKFHDKYFSSIDFDLSKCLFIFSYNDEDKVNPILKDRMYRITTKGYDKKQKTKIATDYLIPKILKTIKFEKEDIIIPDETIHHIIDNLTDGEKGVRNLKRCLEIIYTKLNLYRLMKPDSELFEKEKTIKVEFPFTVSVDIVKNLIKKVKSNAPPFGMYV